MFKGENMSDTEKKALLKLIKDVKEIKEKIAYLVEATELLVKIETEKVKKGK